MNDSLGRGFCVLLMVSAVASGCNSTPPESLGSRSFTAGNSAATLHQHGDQIALVVWTDQGKPGGAGHSETPPGYFGERLLPENRRLDWRCETSDGKHGIVRFTLDGEHVPKDGKPYQLVVGPLFLISTRGDQVTIRQLNVELSGLAADNRGLAEGEAKLKALAESNDTVKEFLAATGK